MKPVFRLLFALALATPAVAALTGEAAKIQSEVRRLDGMRVEALLKNDVKALERLYSDRMVYVHSAGRIDDKQGYLGSLRAGNLTYLSIRYDPAPQVVVAGEATAVVTGRAAIEFKTRAGQPMKRVLTTTTVYVREPDAWRVISYQATPAQ